MHIGTFVFAQIVQFLPQRQFRRILAKYNDRTKGWSMSHWNHLLVLMFGQLMGCGSLRELTDITTAHAKKSKHLGFGHQPINRQMLSKANALRDHRIFEEFAYFLVAEARVKRKTDIFNLGGNVYAFDSTTIDLCLSVFWWARFRRHKGGVKVHFLYDVETQIPAFFHITDAATHDCKAMDEIPYESGSYYVFDKAYNDFKRLHRIAEVGAIFVLRAKKNLKFRIIRWKRRLPKNVLSDCVIELTGYYPGKYYPAPLRLIRFWDEDQEREFMFLTNSFSLTSLQVALLYKNRWQVELFHKWLKQHLKIKKFWGTSENAVRIQIYCAICSYCLVAIVQHDMKLERSAYEVLQVLGVSLTDTTPLRELFDKTKSQNFNERSASDGQLYINF